MSPETLTSRSEMAHRPQPSRNGQDRLPFALGVASAPQATSNPPLTVLALMHCLRRRWKAVLSWGLLLGLLAALSIVIFLPPARPNAFSKIYFPPNPNKPLFGNQDIPLNAQTQKELLLSSKILDQVLKMPEVAALPSVREKPNPKLWLARELHLDFPTGSEIMRITLYGERPEDLVTVVDAVTYTYLNTVGNDSVNQREKQLAHYESLYQKAKEDFDRLYSEMIKKGSSVGSTDSKTIAAQIQLVADQLKSKRSEGIVLVKRVEELKRELEAAQQRNSQPIDPKDPVFESLLATDSEMVALQQERRQIEKKRDADLPFLSPDHPDRKKHDLEVTRIRKQVEARITELRPAVEGRLRDRYRAEQEKVEQDLTRMKTQQRTVQEEINQLDQESMRLNSAVASVEGKRPELLDKENEVNRYKGLLQRLKNEMDAPFRGEVLEAGTLLVPNETIRRVRFGVIGFVLMFGLVTMGLAFWEYRAHRIASIEEVSEHLGLTVLGVIPGPMTSAAPPPDAETAYPRTAPWVNESIDSTRTLLLHTAESEGLRVLLVTSAVSNEGKTSLCQQLAQSLARAGRSVILVDGDLRSPALHTLFRLPLQMGVCEFLRGEASSDEIIRPTALPNLWVIPSGKCDALALQQLSRDGFPLLLQELRTQAEFILIDSSPVLPVADTLQMAGHVDGVLLSLMSDVSQMNPVSLARQRLQSIGVNIMGAVLNGTKHPTTAYGIPV